MPANLHVLTCHQESEVHLRSVSAIISRSCADVTIVSRRGWVGGGLGGRDNA